MLHETEITGSEYISVLHTQCSWNSNLSKSAIRRFTGDRKYLTDPY